MGIGKTLIQAHGLAYLAGSLLDFLQRSIFLGRFEFTQQFFLPACKAGRREYHNLHQYITSLTTAGVGQTFAGQPQQSAALHASRYLQRQWTVQAGYFYLMAKSCLYEADLLPEDQILSFTLPAFVLLNGKHHIEVTGGAAVYAGFPFTAQTQTCACVNTGRHAYRQLACVGYGTLALAARAWLADNLPCTVAGLTRHGYLEKAL